MAKSQETFNKKEKEKLKQKKKQDKLAKREERKANQKAGITESMIAYVDENGHITDTQPDPLKKRKVNANSIEVSVSKQEKIGPQVYSGKVDFYNTEKGFGFIKDIQTQNKYFFHVNGLLQPVAEGDTVTFELEKGLKGMNCVHIKK